MGSNVAVGLAGCGHDTGAETDDATLTRESITVGVLAPERAASGESLKNGAEFAAERINADGGIAGASLELRTADTDFKPDRARAEHERLCEAEDCDLTLGLSLHFELEETLPSIAAQETIHLTTGAFSSATGERVAEDYDTYKYHFRPGLPNYRQLADALATFTELQADGCGWERVGILTENSKAATPFHERLTTHIEERFGDVLEMRGPALSGHIPLLQEYEDEGCDVLLAGQWLGGTVLMNQWAQNEFEFDLGGVYLPTTAPEYWKNTDGNVESVFSLNAVTPTSENTSRTRAFVVDYEQQYDRYPMWTGALTYDALRLYREAVESIVAEDDAEFPSQEQIVEALEDVTFTDGVVYSEFEFTGRNAEAVHEPVWESMADSGSPVVQQWQADAEGGGVIETIGPEENQTATLQPRPWDEP